MGLDALTRWQQWLQSCANDGSLLAAAVEALQLPGATEPLLTWLAALRRGDDQALPPVVVVPGAALNGALGAYASSSGSIYLNGDWQQNASEAQVLAVLTEELGHHLDRLLNASDTPGDEGELFAALLCGQRVTANELERLRREDDRGVVVLDGEAIEAELAADTTAPTITGLVLGNTVLNPSVGGGAYLSVRLSFADDSSGFTIGFLVFKSTISGQEISIPFNALDNGSTLQLGSSSFTDLIGPHELANGEWRLNSVHVEDLARNALRKSSADADWTSFLSKAGLSQSSFNVIGSQPDPSPPQIKRLSIFNPVIDRSIGGQELKGILEFSDDLSGFDSLSLSYNGANNRSYYARISLDDYDGRNVLSFSGTPLDGQIFWRDTFLTGDNGLNGEARLSSLSITDKAGRKFVKYSSDADWAAYLGQIGLSSMLTITGVSPTPNSVPGTQDAVLTGYTLPRRVFNPTQQGGDCLVVSLSWKDDNVEPFVGVTFANRLNPSISVSALFYGGNRPFQNPDGSFSGVLRSSTTLNPYLAKGDYDLTAVSISSSFHSIEDPDWEAYLQSSGLVGFGFNVVGAASSPEDVTAPKLKSLKIPGSVLKNVSRIAVDASYEDDLSGFRALTLSYKQRGENLYTVLNAGTNGGDVLGLFRGTPLSGQLTQMAQIDLSRPGIYDLSHVQLEDNAGNFFMADSDEPGWLQYLQESGITQTTITVLDAPAATLPVITINVTPGSVTEDGATNLIYTFTRSGPVTSSLTINYQLTGTASIGSDFSGIDVTPALKSVTFAAGSAIATVTVDPTPDALSEPDETVVLTILDQTTGAPIIGGVGPIYSVGSPAFATGVIVNPIPPAGVKSAIKAVNGVTLLQDSISKLYSVAVGPGGPVEISYGGGAVGSPVSDTTFAGFQLLAAAQVNGINTLLWRHQPSNQVLTWSLDGNWRQVGGTGLVPVTNSASSEVRRFERQFQLDLDGNQVIGVAESSLRVRTSDDNHGLVRRSDQRLAVFGAAGPDLSWGGAPLRENDSRLAGWTAIAAARVNGVNSLLWRRAGTGELAMWTFDSLWSATGGSAPVGPSSTQAQEYERVFGVDANGDRAIGSPRVPVASASGGGEALYRDAFTRRLTTATGTPLLWGGAPLLENDPRLVGWTAVAFRSIGGNRLLWREEATGNLAQWTFDANGSATGGTAPVNRFSAEAYGYESDYNLDANGDRSIGSPWQPIAYSVTLNDPSNDNPRWLLQRNSSSNVLGVSFSRIVETRSVIPLTWGGSGLMDGDPRLAGWTAVAATSEPTPNWMVSTNKLLWRQEGSGNLASWTFDANWSAVSGDPAVGGNSSDAYALENSFGIDANRDGTIGDPGADLAWVSRNYPYALFRYNFPIGPVAKIGNRLWVKDGGQYGQLLWGDSYLTEKDPRLAGWTAVAAAPSDAPLPGSGGISLLWRETATNNLATWSFDRLLRATGGTAPVASTSAAAYGYESRYGLDLNGDRSIDLPFTVISTSSGGSSLVRLAGSRQLAISSADGAITPLRWGGAPLLDGDARLTGWSALAVIPATATTGPQLLWQQAGSGQAVTWTFDSNGTAISGSDPLSAGTNGFNGLEQSFLVDLNGDRCIGNPYTTLAVSGAIALQRHSSSGRLAISSNGGAAIGLSWGGSDLLDGDSRLSGWTALAAARVNGTNQLLWQQAGSRAVVTWTLDGNWSPPGGTAPIDVNSASVLDLETSFGVDLNGDRSLGEPQSVIERLRGLIQSRSANSNASTAFDTIATGGATADVLRAPSSGNVLLSGFDTVTGQGLVSGGIDVLDGGSGSARVTYGLWSATGQPFAADGDSGYTLIRNYRASSDDLVINDTVTITWSPRTVAGPSGTVTGLGLHGDSNNNGVFDSGDNLIALLEGITTVPSRLIRIPVA